MQLLYIKYTIRAILIYIHSKAMKSISKQSQLLITIFVSN